ncbi:hypothetical protein V4R08_02035 [Nitrobacter sp. NHB1]
MASYVAVLCERNLFAKRLAQLRAFSSEVDTGSREENASNQNHRASF